MQNTVLCKQLHCQIPIYLPSIILSLKKFQDKNTKAEPLSQTYYWNEAEFERIDDSFSAKFVPNFETNKTTSEKLTPCTYTQCCDPEPVPQGYYRMEISIDMMEQLTQLFGFFLKIFEP